jgi:hypothetical protein
MRITRSGPILQVEAPGGPETFTFDTEAEAAGRQAFVEEALSWTGTPFVDCSDIKGPGGAVDCAMLLTRCAIDTGLVPAFDPRPIRRAGMSIATRNCSSIFWSTALAHAKSRHPAWAISVCGSSPAPTAMAR